MNTTINSLHTVLLLLCISIMPGLFSLRFIKRKRDKTSGKETKDYMTIGMLSGICIGAAINTDYTVYGMLFGMITGMLIKKK